ncbi:hypothetical protein [Patulibacter minatonensis]|uniref:hypothetical protein n=1 Tax=Patulibacter minatonensis TaxID=298163 RepID=UPI0006849726|nr:hypothetical protein [Patulibacter minatonensis]
MDVRRRAVAAAVVGVVATLPFAVGALATDDVVAGGPATWTAVPAGAPAPGVAALAPGVAGVAGGIAGGLAGTVGAATAGVPGATAVGSVAEAVVPALLPRTPARSAVLRRVRAAVEDVVGADGSRYDAKDDTGANLEGLKIAAAGAPGTPGAGSSGGSASARPRYVGVYHHRVGRDFVVAVAVSDDLRTWRRVRTLQHRASQPTLRRLADGSWLTAWEQEPRNHVRLRHAATLDALLAGRFDATFDAPLTLAPTAEGTPDIRDVRLGDGIADSTIEVGFHYYRAGDVDREAVATLTDFRHWTARPRPDLDRALWAQGLRGNFGDRDTFAWGGTRFEVVEGQGRKGDWGSWRTTLRDLGTGETVPLRMRARFGQTSFGNPTVSVLPGPRGGTVLFTTAFVFGPGAPRGAGELLSWRRVR